MGRLFLPCAKWIAMSKKHLPSFAEGILGHLRFLRQHYWLRVLKTTLTHPTNDYPWRLILKQRVSVLKLLRVSKTHSQTMRYLR